MLRLQRYLLVELLGAFVLVLVILTGIILAASLLQILRKLPDLSVFALAQAVPVLVMLALPLSVPLSFLMACLLSYGRFADDNEFLALQMGGLSPWHAVAPGLCAAAVLAIGTLHMNTDLNPTMTNARNQILRGQIREEISRMRDPSRTNVRLPDMEMSWERREGEWFRNVVLSWVAWEEPKDGGEKVRKPHRLVADGATVAFVEGQRLRLVVTLESARMPIEEGTWTAKRTQVVLGFDEESALTETKGVDEMRASELYYHIVRLEPVLGVTSPARGTERPGRELKSYHKYSAEYWRRIALGLSPIAFALLGVPLGLVARRGSRAVALVIAMLVVLPVYYPLLLWGQNLAREGHAPASIALNMGNALLAAAGIALVGRLVTR